MERVKVLCVDDEPHVLENLALHLRRTYDVVVATSGRDGLEKLAKQGPFAVVLSDMRMPGMDGATFLSQVREAAPNTTRMLLTGHADVQSAIATINEGQVFRFLTKPCPPDQLLESFKAAAERYRRITVEGAVRKQLEEEARTDRLTQLANRSAFDKDLMRELALAARQASPLSLVMIDIDNFKRFNDTYGHQAGDAVLAQVGATIRQMIRECDTPARYGGEEFAVILPFTNEGGGWLAAERLRRAIAGVPVNWQGKALSVAASIGGATLEPVQADDDVAEKLIGSADVALYRAKNQGRNQVCWQQAS